jgi:hypothetical protein
MGVSGFAPFGHYPTEPYAGSVPCSNSSVGADLWKRTHAAAEAEAQLSKPLPVVAKALHRNRFVAALVKGSFDEQPGDFRDEHGRFARLHDDGIES